MRKRCERQLFTINIVKMASLRLFVLTIVLFVGIVINVEARVETRSQRAQRLASVEKPSKDDSDTFETLTKLKG